MGGLSRLLTNRYRWPAGPWWRLRARSILDSRVSRCTEGPPQKLQSVYRSDDSILQFGFEFISSASQSRAVSDEASHIGYNINGGFCAEKVYRLVHILVDVFDHTHRIFPATATSSGVQARTEDLPKQPSNIQSLLFQRLSLL